MQHHSKFLRFFFFNLSMPWHLLWVVPIKLETFANVLCKGSSGETATVNKCLPLQMASKSKVAAAAPGHLGLAKYPRPVPIELRLTSVGSLTACCLDFPNSFRNPVKTCWKMQGGKFDFIVWPHGPSVQIWVGSTHILLYTVVPSAQSLGLCSHGCSSCSFWPVRLRL